MPLKPNNDQNTIESLSKVTGVNQSRTLQQLSQYFFQLLKYEKWMNTFLSLVKLGPFYIKFGVGLLVRCH